MKEITEGKAALDSRLEPNEEIRSIILCAYNARLSARYTPYRGVLAATDRRFMFYSSLFGSPFHLDIRYDAVTSFRREKGLVTRGDHLVVMNNGDWEAFQYFSGCDPLETFVEAVRKLKKLPEDIIHSEKRRLRDVPAAGCSVINIVLLSIPQHFINCHSIRKMIFGIPHGNQSKKYIIG
ncbi:MULTISPECIES: PH domain-containing protein [Bacillus]|uniref:PH domain-containing protein n=1 Tax=Bacillus TaxID=1386 RepID=UPI00031B48DD|nr:MULTISPECIES: PH domain-containing protein [Bacillus]MEC1491746.1 PH domain-containing protein [Bacillus licheniformis]MEC3834698.1 PH domain-containing protein [Bacillus licheniformis]MED4335410.1 PH domain-containing protein [Bacillus licheniformis]MED4371868.1 PH domain-containing protein [Bacillus licheniformis]